MPYQEVHKYRSWVEVDLDHFARNWKEMKRLVLSRRDGKIQAGPLG